MSTSPLCLVIRTVHKAESDAGRWKRRKQNKKQKELESVEAPKDGQLFFIPDSLLTMQNRTTIPTTSKKAIPRASWQKP